MIKIEKTEDLKKLDLNKLIEKSEELKKVIAEVVIKLRTGVSKNTSEAKKVKRYLARIMTIISQKRLALSE